MKQERHLDGMVGYFQREMQYLLHSGRQFATQYPKVAQYLDLHQSGSDDPHVQRLLESFAFLTGRLQSEIDDRFSSISTSLLETLYPQFTQPIPSATLIQINPTVEMGKQMLGYVVEKGTQMLTQAEEGHICRFQTTSPLTLYPLEVQDVSCIRSQLCDIPIQHLRSPWVLRVRVKCYAGDFGQLNLSKLCFHICGDMLTRNTIFEWLFTYESGLEMPVFVQPEGSSTPILLSPNALTPIGFEEETSLFPFPVQSHSAYRLLLEYFVFPQKFLGFQIEGIPQCTGQYMDLLFPLGEEAKPEKVPLSKESVQLNCVPGVNLFFKTSEPIRLDHRQLEYKLTSDYRQEATTEIHSILKIAASSDYEASLQHYAPYFSFNHEVQALDSPSFWIGRRAHSQTEGCPGTDLFLSFVDYQFNPSLPPEHTLYAHTLCTNRSLAETVPAGAKLQAQGNLTGVVAKILERPTPEIIPSLDGESQWRLISHLSINHVGLCGTYQTIEPLQELLRLYSLMERGNPQNEAEALLSLSHRKGMARFSKEAWHGFVPKLSVELTVDEARPNAHSLFLLGGVLAEVFRLCAGFNTLVETSLIRYHRQHVWKTWHAKPATQPCL